MTTHDPLREAFQIREQLAPAERRLAFFFGAGTSMAVGMPGITTLTEQVGEKLQEPHKSHYKKVIADLPMEKPNVENVLDHIRICRELFAGSEEREYGCLTGATTAKELDSQVCQAIRFIVGAEPPQKPKPQIIFSQWLQQLRNRRDWPVEVFTTNYDLLLEQAMEKCAVPFFDGFIGSVDPFFAPESVEAAPSKHSEGFYPPRTWTRLWKLHGSINWYLPETSHNDMARISRGSGSGVLSNNELVIFPSREKYAQSRKLPFLAFQDRLRKFVSYGPCLILVLGYSFSDEHLDEIIFQGLRSNPDLAATVFTRSPLPERLVHQSQELRNLTVYGPDRACIGGVIGSWGNPSRAQKEAEYWPFWDSTSKQFKLGDFNSFASFLELFIGFGLDSFSTSTPSTSEEQMTEIPNEASKA